MPLRLLTFAAFVADSVIKLRFIMTDIAGMLINIPSTFVSCVQCFEYIQFDRDFERDQKALVLRLDLLQTRLVRWGDCVGIMDEEGELSVRKDLRNPPEKHFRKIPEG
jgi:hypothetical protein